MKIDRFAPPKSHVAAPMSDLDRYSQTHTESTDTNPILKEAPTTSTATDNRASTKQEHAQKERKGTTENHTPSSAAVLATLQGIRRGSVIKSGKGEDTSSVTIDSSSKRAAECAVSSPHVQKAIVDSNSKMEKTVASEKVDDKAESMSDLSRCSGSTKACDKHADTSSATIGKKSPINCAVPGRHVQDAIVFDNSQTEKVVARKRDSDKAELAEDLPRRSGRQKTATNFYYPGVQFLDVTKNGVSLTHIGDTTFHEQAIDDRGYGTKETMLEKKTGGKSEATCDLPRRSARQKTSTNFYYPGVQFIDVRKNCQQSTSHNPTKTHNSLQVSPTRSQHETTAERENICMTYRDDNDGEGSSHSPTETHDSLHVSHIPSQREKESQIPTQQVIDMTENVVDDVSSFRAQTKTQNSRGKSQSEKVADISGQESIDMTDDVVDDIPKKTSASSSHTQTKNSVRVSQKKTRCKIDSEISEQECIDERDNDDNNYFAPTNTSASSLQGETATQNSTNVPHRESQRGKSSGVHMHENIDMTDCVDNHGDDENVDMTDNVDIWEQRPRKSGREATPTSFCVPHAHLIEPKQPERSGGRPKDPLVKPNATKRSRKSFENETLDDRQMSDKNSDDDLGLDESDLGMSLRTLKKPKTENRADASHCDEQNGDSPGKQRSPQESHARDSETYQMDEDESEDDVDGSDAEWTKILNIGYVPTREEKEEFLRLVMGGN